MTHKEYSDRQQALIGLSADFDACNFMCAVAMYGTRSILHSLKESPPDGFAGTLTRIEQPMKRQQIADQVVIHFSGQSRFGQEMSWYEWPLHQAQSEIHSAAIVRERATRDEFLRNFLATANSPKLPAPNFLKASLKGLLQEWVESFKADGGKLPYPFEARGANWSAYRESTNLSAEAMKHYSSAIASAEYDKARAMHDAIRQLSIFGVAVGEHYLAHQGYGVEAADGLDRITQAVQQIFKNVDAIIGMSPRYDWAFIRQCGQQHVYNPESGAMDQAAAPKRATP